MAARLGLFALVLTWSLRLAVDFRKELIVWNVGQGQWVTLVDESGCWHFDMGGEKAPWRGIRRVCRGRRNFLTFSHWDWDHISFARTARYQLPNACLLYGPVGPTSAYKRRQISGYPLCRINAPFETWVNPSGRTANDKSRVVWWRGILIPGDSPRAQEKLWLAHFPHLQATRILILGHHGSRTSTGLPLLDRLLETQAAVASARFAKYGHPHAETRRNLARHRIPLLRTEDWGTIVFEL
jgi:competence protein ComEC